MYRPMSIFYLCMQRIFLQLTFFLFDFFRIPTSCNWLALVQIEVMATSPGNLARIFDPSPGNCKENGDIFVMSFLQPSKTRKISYREQQELLRIALEEHPEFNKQGMILDTIEKGGKLCMYLYCTRGWIQIIWTCPKLCY